MKTLKIFIFITWIIVGAFFIYGQGYLDFTGSDEGVMEPGDYNYRVFFRNSRAGEINVSLQDNHLNAEGRLSFFSFGQHNSFNFRGLAILSPSGTAESLMFKLNANGHDTVIRGTESGNNMMIEIKSGDMRTSFLTNSRIHLSDMMIPAVNLVPGKQQTMNVSNPLTGRNEHVSVTFEGIDHVNRVRLNRFSVQQKNLNSTVWTCRDGKIAMAYVPPGFTIVAEELEKDFIIQHAPREEMSDLISELKFGTDIEVQAPESAKKAEFSIGGIAPSDYHIRSPRQVAEKGRLTVFAQSPPEYGKSFPLHPDFEPLRKYLKPEPLINSADPSVIEKAAEIIGQETCAWEASKKINRWLFENLKKVYSPGIPSSLIVLETMEGDCNEHTFLFIALARSAGIPARANIGLAYHDGAFYYHAWPSVYVGQWVEMDPTFGWDTVSALHIRLISGGLEEQMKLAGLAGSLKLEHLSVSYDKNTGAD